MEKMLVTQGLNELSLLDSRINKAINNGAFISPAKTNEKKVTPNKTKEAFTSEARAAYQSILDLISRRDRIKKATNGWYMGNNATNTACKKYHIG